MKKLLLTLSLVPSLVSAAFINGYLPESEVFNDGRVYDGVTWQGANPASWEITYLGTSAAFTDVFEFQAGNVLFNNKTSLQGATEAVTGSFEFLFTSPLGWVNQDHTSRGPVSFLSTISENGRTVTLWLDDGGAGVDKDFNDMGVQISAVPIPAAAWLFGSTLLGMLGVSRKKRLTWQQHLMQD